jgi:hygromycin-B 7''-O-kinase
MMDNITQKLKSISSSEEFEELKLDSKFFEDVVKKILAQHNLPIKSLKLFPEGTNIVFSYDDSLVIKLFPPFNKSEFASERLVLKALEKKLSVETPTIFYVGEIENWSYIIMTELKGTLLESIWDDLDHNNKLIIIKEIGALIKEVHSLPVKGLESIDCNWKKFIEHQISNCVEHHKIKNLPDSLLNQIPAYIEPIRESLFKDNKIVLLTGEYTPMNFIVNNKDGMWHISGLIDFGDAMLGNYQYDLLGPAAFLIQGDKELLNTFLNAYGYRPSELNSTLSYQLNALLLLHKYSNLEVQVRIDGWKNKASTLEELEQLLWGF